jgi:hypothetical protein
MTGPYATGCGVVSPAGWGLGPFRQALSRGEPLPVKEVTRPGMHRPARIRPVPVPTPRPAFLGHPRLRRTSPIAQFTVAAALEAIGPDAEMVRSGELSLGIIVCVMSACVIYSRRFYDETLKDPATASPLVFPETVFNAPASHLAALLGSTSINYTMVGDPAIFLQGLALAADWLSSGRVETCLVIGSEEADWITSEAFNLFDRDVIMSEGAGAVYLQAESNDSRPVRLTRITNPQPYTRHVSRQEAVERVRKEINGTAQDLLCDSLHGIEAVDRAEELVWHDWRGPRLSPRKILGEGLMAGAAWQCVAAIDALVQGHCQTAVANVVGCNEEAIAAEFAAA